MQFHFIRKVKTMFEKLLTSLIASDLRLIFNEMFRFLIENNLIFSNQSGFKLRDFFPIGLVKTESGFIVRSGEAGLGR